MRRTRSVMTLKSAALDQARGRARLWAKYAGKVNQARCKNQAPGAAEIAIIRNPWDNRAMSGPDKQQRFQRTPGKGPSRGRGGGPAWRERHERSDGLAILYGWHTVAAALANPRRRIRKLLLTENAARRLSEENIDTRVPPEIVRPNLLDARLGPDAVHQGFLAEADPLAAPELGALPRQGIVLVLDQITDPHNVGAILRSAAAFAVNAIVTTARHSPEATGVLAKSASGALELVPLVTVQNLARALTELHDSGFLTVGLDSEGSADLGSVELRQPLALVLGAEGKGLRQLTRQTCSVVARLDLPGEIKSLNVSNAAVLALYIGASRLGLMK